MRILTRGCCLGQQHPRHNNNSSDVPLYRFEYFPSTALSRQSTNYQCISQVQEPPPQCLEITHQSSRNMTQRGRGYRQLEMSHQPWQEAHVKHWEDNYSDPGRHRCARRHTTGEQCAAETYATRIHEADKLASPLIDSANARTSRAIVGSRGAWRACCGTCG